MEITEVKIFLVDEEKLRAFVSIVLDQCFMINDIKVIQGRDGLFISMPSRRKKNGEFKDVAHPLNNQTRGWMEKRILDEYQRLRDARAAEEAGGAVAKDGATEERGRAVEPGGNGHGASVPVVSDKPAAAVAAAPVELSEPQDAGAEERLSDVAREHLSDSYWSVG